MTCPGLCNCPKMSCGSPVLGKNLSDRKSQEEVLVRSKVCRKLSQKSLNSKIEKCKSFFYIISYHLKFYKAFACFHSMLRNNLKSFLTNVHEIIN
jgi:hypothetical protein